jgi:hypothetical protein
VIYRFRFGVSGSATIEDGKPGGGGERGMSRNQNVKCETWNVGAVLCRARLQVELKSKFTARIHVLLYSESG